MKAVAAERTSSEAIFGSSARGTIDRFSDRDYLVVDDRADLRSRRSASLERQGWSVASYSWPRLEAILRKRALFGQHLKQEAIIVYDDDDRLKHELSLFQPKDSYTIEIAQTAQLISATTSNIRSSVERAWVSDVLAVAIRNLGIFALAEMGEYCFDYDNVVCAYVNMNGLGTELHGVLGSLRAFKTQYRAGYMSTSLSTANLELVCSTLARTTAGPHYSDFRDREPFNYPRHLPPYASQRLVERDLLISKNSTDADFGLYSRVRRRVRKKLVKPRDYGWEFSKSGSEIWADVSWLKKHSIQVQ